MLDLKLQGKRAVIAGIGDDKGYGWAIAKALAEAGCEVIALTWAPLYKLFTQAFERGKFDASRELSDGSLFNFAAIYPIDATFDSPEHVPSEIKENKRYKECENYTVQEVAEAITERFGTIDLLIHSMANAPEVKKSLLDTSREGYLAAMSSSSYSLISLLRALAPHFRADGAALSLSYVASQRTIPGYGGGMSSAKAALESDTRTLAWELGRKYGIRINAISAGPLGSRAATAIGMINTMIETSKNKSPLNRELQAEEVAHAAVFLLSPLSSAITGEILFVDNGLHAMGVLPDQELTH